MERRCGECTLCCQLLPVKSLGKKDGERCKHQRGVLSLTGRGCSVYHKAGFPGECGLWNCRWLIDPSTAPLLRPDISHYVIDIVPDFVTAEADGREQKAAAIQIWIDPRYPDAHKDPALREWLRQNEPHCVALIRSSAYDAIVLIPPQMSDTGDWEEIGGNRARMGEGTHSAEEVAGVLSSLGAMK